MARALLHHLSRMRSRLLIPLLLGSLGGCALSTEERPPADPEESPDPDPSTPSGPLTPAQEAKALLAEWSGCMSLANFTSASMASAWSQIPTTDGSGACTRCHVSASPSFPVSSNAETFFTMLSEHLAPMLLLFTVDLASRPGKVIVDTRIFEAAGSGMPPHALHPRFTIAGAPMTALTSFYDATVARKAAGACDPPRLKD
jgi:hypothetical protein